MHEPQWGWVLEAEDHTKLHGDWLKDWRDWLDDMIGRNEEITLAKVKAKLKDMMNSDKYRKYLRRGRKANVWYQLKHLKNPPPGAKKWKNSTPEFKMETWKKLKKIGAVLAVVGAVVGAADDACAAFAPILALDDPNAQQMYEAIIKAIEEGRYDDAHRLLFGRYDQCALDQPNPDGLFCKLLAAQLQANPLAYNRILEIEELARRRWSERTSQLGDGQTGQAADCECSDPASVGGEPSSPLDLFPPYQPPLTWEQIESGYWKERQKRNVDFWVGVIEDLYSQVPGLRERMQNARNGNRAFINIEQGAIGG